MPPILTFRFRQTRSNEMPWRLKLAKQGTFAEEALSSTLLAYRAVFDVVNPLHLAPAISLATALVHDKTAEATVDGQHIPIPHVRAVLMCYEQSWQVDDLRAFCWVPLSLGERPGVYEMNFNTDPSQAMLPCRLAANRVHLVRPSNPAAMRDQIKAVLVKAHTHWCPRIELDACDFVPPVQKGQE